MNILVLTGKFGMGHWSASQSLRQRIVQAVPGASVRVEDFIAHALPSASQAIYKAFSLLVTRGSVIYNTYYKLTENQKNDGAPWLAALFQDQFAQLLETWSPDFVISTHPFCAQVVSRYKEETGASLPLVTCITDLSSHSEWIAPGTDCYMVGSFEIKRQLVEKGIPEERICVGGIPVKAEFRPRMRRGAPGVRHLLIMGGGLGLMPKRDRFYEKLNAMPGVKCTIIAGQNQKLYDRLFGAYENIEIVGYTDRVYDYMARADLMLSKPGGITLFETIFSELPILAWAPFLQQEINNAKFLVKAGIGRTVGKEVSQCIRAIEDLIYDDGALLRMSQNMCKMKAQLETESLERVFAILAARKEAGVP